MEITFDDVRAFAERHIVPFAIDLLVAILVFYVGRKLARILVRALGRAMERSKLDVSLRKFLGDVAYAILLVAVVTAALDTVGIQTTAVIAVLGAAGLAVGLALQGSLANFAAGVMIIVLRPYKVGDLVVVGKHTGRVEAIKVFHTFLITGDHREVIIPNGKIIADSIENMTVLGTRRVDLLITVGHDTNLNDAKQWLEAVVKSDRRVLDEPEPVVDLSQVTAEGVVLNVRPWVAGEQYPDVASDMLSRIKDTFDAHRVKFQVSLVS
jgi:small conductance mechanosensitive channel